MEEEEQQKENEDFSFFFCCMHGNYNQNNRQDYRMEISIKKHNGVNRKRWWGTEGFLAKAK